jgi:CheY-like chemotaxis protein
VRLVTRRLLERHGYRVVEAANGREGLACYEHNRSVVAAVITDLIMPEMDGLSFIQQLRKTNPRLPVIAASGYPGGVDMASLGDDGAHVLMMKPFESAELLDQLDRLLRS